MPDLHVAAVFSSINAMKGIEGKRLTYRQADRTQAS